VSSNSTKTGSAGQNMAVYYPAFNNMATSSRLGCFVVIAPWTTVSLSTASRLSRCL